MFIKLQNRTKCVLCLNVLLCRYNYQLSQVRKELRCCRSKVADQQKQIVEYAARLDEYDKKTEETNRKFSTMLQVIMSEILKWVNGSIVYPIPCKCWSLFLFFVSHILGFAKRNK